MKLNMKMIIKILMKSKKIKDNNYINYFYRLIKNTYIIFFILFNKEINIL